MCAPDAARVHVPLEASVCVLLAPGRTGSRVALVPT